MSESEAYADGADRPLPFAERNADDFAEYTRRIQVALDIISRDRRQPATKANLAKLSGVHRNTLRHRSQSEVGSKKQNDTFGWPYSALSEIVRQRKRQEIEDVEATVPAASLDERVKYLEQRLAKSRYQVASWYNRSIELKRERDEARRSIALLMGQQKHLKEEVDHLRKQLVQKIRVVK